MWRVMVMMVAGLPSATSMVCASMLAMTCMTGCAGAPSYPQRSHVLDAVVPGELPGGAALPAETSFAKWKATASRLAADVPRAVKRADWGLLEMQMGAADEQGRTTTPLRAEALLPDNRMVVIHVWALGENEVAAAVRVGRFGDARVEREFLQMLADTLADKPMPKRGGGFELPPLDR